MYLEQTNKLIEQFLSTTNKKKIRKNKKIFREIKTVATIIIYACNQPELNLSTNQNFLEIK